jgi:integrase
VGGKGEAWLPLLGLFTGARLGELCHPLVSDVQCAEGIDYINLTDEGDEQAIKTVGSRRRVPIHPELVRLGFLDYVKGRKAAKDERLFPLLKQGWNGSWTDNC